ncbi:MAG: polymer-forming cytoskeletal protein [Saprospiraceae bacterium]|nr:polymer-forming cytoskeletal protein [Saprospiraceae bacterium]
MFGKKTETQSTGTTRSSNSLLHNSLVQGSRLEGKVTSENDFRIDGVFHGSLKCSARVIIGPTGEFKGEVECENAIIEGRFDGNLQIRQVLEVREGAIIEGDVTTSKLIVQAGSVFDVKCSMGDHSSGFSTNKIETEDESLLSEIENGQIE